MNELKIPVSTIRRIQAKASAISILAKEVKRYMIGDTLIIYFQSHRRQSIIFAADIIKWKCFLGEINLRRFIPKHILALNWFNWVMCIM